MDVGAVRAGKGHLKGGVLPCLSVVDMTLLSCSHFKFFLFAKVFFASKSPNSVPCVGFRRLRRKPRLMLRSSAV